MVETHGIVSPLAVPAHIGVEQVRRSLHPTVVHFERDRCTDTDCRIRDNIRIIFM